ncbi:hypothetical protein HU200_035115 [Digitaria exilis]|uniref:Uncharacterized protein n=1 Tax=Digitaria exilis TaxID=1010633 RepID=A0A835EQ21_9POAL|nr:hypothetical protein HU200_035115 [Digitaria exilis]
MASQQGAAPTLRSGVADDVRAHTDAENDPLLSAPEDFEFCILSSGGLALAGDDAAAVDMCVADEVFSGGKLLPFRFSSAKSVDAPPSIVLLRSDSLDASSSSSTSGFSSRSVSRSTSSSSSSSSSSVSRSTSSKSASSDHAGVLSFHSKVATAANAATVPSRRSLSSSVFYAHPASPSPRAPPRRTSAARRRSTGTAPPASWGLIRLGVVGAPEVYAPRPAAEHRKVAAGAAARSGGSRSARFDQQPRIVAGKEEKKKLGVGLLGAAGLVCSCSPDAVVAPVGSAEARRRRKKKAEEKKKNRASKQSGQSTARRRSRILEWMEELSLSREKSVV